MSLCGLSLFYEKGIITTEKKDFILRKYSAHAAFDLLIEKHPVLKPRHLHRQILSCLATLFQNESQGKAFHIKMSLFGMKMNL